ncbi:hypothetical protein ACWCXH_07475 [Kitasatospora sp. NPDC001660]
MNKEDLRLFDGWCRSWSRSGLDVDELSAGADQPLRRAAGAWLLTTVHVGIDNVVKVSFRQHATPDHLLGRMNATMRVLLTGALTIGAAGAGMLASLTSVRAALWAGAVGLMVVWVPIYCSPLRTARDLPGV